MGLRKEMEVNQNQNFFVETLLDVSEAVFIRFLSKVLKTGRQFSQIMMRRDPF